jgi:hypothetical protein
MFAFVRQNSLEILGDYRCCERLQKCIGKKVTAAQTLNAHHCKEQFRKSPLALIPYENSICALFLVARK